MGSLYSKNMAAGRLELASFWLTVHKCVHIPNFRDNSDWPCLSQNLCLKKSLYLGGGSDLISQVRRLNVNN